MRTIKIWLTPEKESAASEQEVADSIGISLVTLKNRLKLFGEDHYLTYFPGNIPYNVRRFKNADRSKSTIGSIKRDEKRLLVSNEVATLFVTKLIKFSKLQYENKGCQESRAFLLNENGMLGWYLEAYPGIDAEALLNRLKKWVLSNLQ